MIAEAIAWFALILLINAFIAVFIADPIKQISFVDAMASVLVIEIIAFLLAALVMLFGWSIETLFFKEGINS